MPRKEERDDPGRVIDLSEVHGRRIALIFANWDSSASVIVGVGNWNGQRLSVLFDEGGPFTDTDRALGDVRRVTEGDPGELGSGLSSIRWR
jgi:hypothetical protein